MKCLRCGYCCKNYLVPVVDDPEVGINDGNIIAHMGNGTPCKHLIGNSPGKYSCGIHHYPWYKETPCFSHTQIERDDTNCRLGEHILASLTKDNLEN